MHILIIHSGHFLTSLCPIAGIFEYHQAKALQESGHQVGIISSDVISARFIFKNYSYLQFEEKNGISIFRNYIRKLYPQRWVPFPKAIEMIEKLSMEGYRLYVKKYGTPDVIHGHGIKFSAFVANMIHRMNGIPYVITEHDSEFIKRRSFSLQENILMSKATENASELIAVSSALARAVQEKISVKKVRILPNIVDSMVISTPLIKRFKPMFVFLNIASLDDNKNQATLIEVFAQCFRGKPVSLRLGGKGPRETYLKKLTRRLGIDDQVHFLGFLDRPFVVSEMQAADCFVLASKYETFGVVLIEALASGTPVIATRSGGPEDIVTPADGVLIDVDNPNALGIAMIDMFEKRTNHIPESLRENCKRRFGAKVFVSNLNQIYENALQGGVARLRYEI